LKNDMLIFSPEIEGDYKIHLSITDISHEVISEEIFYYRAIAETLEVAIAGTKPEMDIPTQSSVVKIPTNDIIKLSKSPLKQERQSVSKTENVHYTIQVAAWPSLEQARIDQLELIEEGVDAYIQRNYRKEKDEVWYRVRIGNFSDKIKAQKMQEQIESITGVLSWLDVIPIEKK
jgi:cell division protein FtsN